MQPIKKDEEYFANYGYPMLAAPKWHRDLFRQYAKDNPGIFKPEKLKQLEDYEAELAKGVDKLMSSDAPNNMGRDEEPDSKPISDP